MKVLFDHQTFTHQEYGGISRYFFELATRLQTYPDVDVTSSILFSNNDYIQGSSALPSRLFFRDRNFKGKKRLMMLLNEMRSLRAYRQEAFDIFHPTYYDLYYMKAPKRAPVVVTCLDMIHEKFMPEDTVTAHNKKVSMNRADKIFAISQSTKNDIMEFYGIEDKKISVTYLASSLGKPERLKQASGADRFFLYVGKRNLYKNFFPFVKAIAPLLLNPDVYLYCAGGGALEKDEQVFLRELKIENKVRLFPGSDESLAKLYSTAVAFIYPSLYEGFGIPVLEAMNCGCPVAVSNTSSLPEVAGDAALYFDPNNIDSVRAAAETFLEKPQVREAMIARGFERAKLFSWDETARVTHSIYKTLV